MRTVEVKIEREWATRSVIRAAYRITRRGRPGKRICPALPRLGPISRIRGRGGAESNGVHAASYFDFIADSETPTTIKPRVFDEHRKTNEDAGGRTMVGIGLEAGREAKGTRNAGYQFRSIRGASLAD